jgi:drug/metabolite transporter (DMT)-like permease
MTIPPEDPIPRPPPPPPPPPNPAAPRPGTIVKHDTTKAHAAAVGGAIAGILIVLLSRWIWWPAAPLWQQLALAIVIGAVLPWLCVYFAPRNQPTV